MGGRQITERGPLVIVEGMKRRRYLKVAHIRRKFSAFGDAVLQLCIYSRRSSLLEVDRRCSEFLFVFATA